MGRQMAGTLLGLSAVGLSLGTAGTARAERTDIPDCYPSCVKECSKIAPKSGDYCKIQCRDFCDGDPPVPDQAVLDDSSGVATMPTDNYVSKLDKQVQRSPIGGIYDLYSNAFGKK
eukprot:CAMPEP_0197538734 /NCGR_PEP_ID=MMETSP1318-20131121/60476_1 /TAXON_ID=552666 /ORGANISM="Partenskyella glossopodia, Strain RCC365" /LENGTH=115 /DNA_ID=CAMNT_0043097229 /DNA_START=107 /DNA_END=454 /DNA_ORIENTATION=-